MYHIAAAYVIADRITELYTYLTLFSITLYIEAAVINSALYCDFILTLTSLI